MNLRLSNFEVSGPDRNRMLGLRSAFDKSATSDDTILTQCFIPAVFYLTQCVLRDRPSDHMELVRLCQLLNTPKETIYV